MIEFHYVPSGSNQLATSVDLPPHMSPGQRVPTVIVVHGLTGQRLGRSYHLVEFGRILADRGFACVRFDQSGCGESTGRFMDLTLPQMAADVTAMLGWVRGQAWCDPRRIGFTALSLGALPTIAADAAFASCGVALWAPVYDMPRVFNATARTGLRGILDGQGWVPYRGLRIGKPFVDHLDAIDTPALLEDGSSPLLLFHSKDDDVVAHTESDDYAARCRQIGRPCQSVKLNHGGHDFFEYADRVKVLTQTADFFQTQFAPTR